jgi:hypothetical protein
MSAIFLDQTRHNQLQTALNNDPEFKLAAKYMSENILLEVNGSRCIIEVQDGMVTAIKLDPFLNADWSFSIKATADTWDKLLQASPPPFYTGLNAASIQGKLFFSGNIEVAFAYYWAMNRLLDVIRQMQNA